MVQVRLPGLMGVMRAVKMLVVAVALVLVFGVSAAWANVPAWHVMQMVAPSHLAQGGKGQLVVVVDNLGDATALASSGEPIAISAQLPAGITATGIATDSGQELFGYGHSEARLSCELATLGCKSEEGFVLPYQASVVLINVSVAANASSGMVKLSVVGGGASPVSVEEPVQVRSAPVAFGVQSFEELPLNENGSVDTQAGSHPFQLTTAFILNSLLQENENFDTEGPLPPALAKELRFELSPGLVGNPTVVPQCPIQKFQGHDGQNECPPETAVGVAQVMISLQGTVFGTLAQPFFVTVGVYNLTPSVGEPARFGFVVGALTPVAVFLDTSVRTGGDYGVTVSVHNISQEVPFLGSVVSFWGVPSDSRHDSARGEVCLAEAEFSNPCPEGSAPPRAPLLMLPSSCSGSSDPLTTTMFASSWAAPSSFSGAGEGEYRLHDDAGHSLGLDGCNRVPFSPSIDVAPDGQEGSTPSGLTVNVHVPQQASLNPTGVAEGEVRDTTVTLPAGVGLNPAGADGLQACGLAQIGLESAEEQLCPEAAKVGTLEIHSPLLPDPLVGAAYLAQQDANPFGSLVALYLVAKDPVSGVLVKLAGEVKPDPVTGQLVSTFKETPQLPFEDLSLHFFGGSRAPLGTPALCGSYTTSASIAPWSGNASVESASQFQITSGPNHTPCSDPLPFHPTLEAGSTNIQTGTFTQFTTTMSREDGEQNLKAIQIHLPEGLVGSLAELKLCGEEQANAGTCGPESLIGHTIVSVGLGGNPYTVTGGEVFITGPYAGAPFGLSIVNPAKAGPFDLGKVIVRAKIEVNPITSALTIATDPSGPHAIPQILDGIPLQIKHVNVLIDRNRFTFNPSNCTPTAITATLTSSEGATANLSMPFQVTNCATLKFKPQFAVSTPGRTSRTNGTSLDVRLTYPVAEGQANIAKVKVELPRQLPSRLPTLQKACTEAVFDQNPESCPVASKVGEAVATTPVLAGELTGPAYFVSRGGAAWPELIVVLRGEDGVTVDLHGETFISKQGITSSTFATVPDVPVGSFELKLPAGPYSALTANGASLCRAKLTMPTEFVAQNGAVIRQSTKIATTGCPKGKRVAHGRGRKGKARGLDAAAGGRRRGGSGRRG